MKTLFSIIAVLPMFFQLVLPKDYKKEIDFYQEWIKHLDDTDFYDKNLTIKNRKTDEIRLFSKFDKFEQKTFILSWIETLDKKLSDTQKQWEKDLDTLQDDSKKADLKKLLTDLKNS